MYYLSPNKWYAQQEDTANQFLCVPELSIDAKWHSRSAQTIICCYTFLYALTQVLQCYSQILAQQGPGYSYSVKMRYSHFFIGPPRLLHFSRSQRTVGSWVACIYRLASNPGWQTRTRIIFLGLGFHRAAGQDDRSIWFRNWWFCSHMMPMFVFRLTIHTQYLHIIICINV